MTILKLEKGIFQKKNKKVNVIINIKESIHGVDTRKSETYVPNYNVKINFKNDKNK